MDIFEFELRYLAYKGLSEKFNIPIADEEIIKLTKRTNLWILPKKLTEITPEELKVLTMETYTDFKREFIEKSKATQIWPFTLAEYIERLEYEFKVIKEMWYNTYFLIVQDYINRAKTHQIAVGPWRWSAAWSLLSYYVWIIDLDPLTYDLLFERFLNPARISMPDIDTDFEDVKREDVVNYVKEKYWENKVASIWTYMTMAAKAAFKDVARVMWLSFEESNKISNLIEWKNIKASIEENEELKSLIEEDTNINKIISLAIKLEWTIRQTWVHACWIIISPELLTTFSPIQYPPKSWSKSEKDESKYVTQYDWHYMEDIGLLKMDFLGLRNLSIIKNTIKIIAARYKNEWKKLPNLFERFFDKMWFYPPLDDAYAYKEIFQKWDTSWVFQFESDWMKQWLIKLKPTDINDIIAMVALYRPWPMEFIPYYIDRKSGKEKIEYLMPEIEEIIVNKYWNEVAEEERRKLIEDLWPFMDITYGIAVYQEQLMRLVQSMAWFSLAEADMLRRWVWKKIKEVVEKIKVDFVQKSWEYHGYMPETADYIYEKMIMPAADYSFNKSHAACYAIIAYQTAYLKAHFPIEFNAALLRSVEEETDKLSKFIDELKMKWAKVLPPSINESFNHVAAVNDTIRLWFLSIKWVWFEVWKTIEEELQKNWKFKNLEDFLKRCAKVINKKSLESLAKSWALDEVEDRKTVLNNMDIVLDRVKNSSNNNGSMWLFDMWNIATWLTFKEKFNTTLLEKLLFEFEIFKTFVSAHPFDWLYTYIKWKYNFISMFKDVENYWEFNIVCFVKSIEKFQKKWFFVGIEDLSWELDFFMKNMADIKEFDILIIKGYKSKSVRVKQIIKVTLDEIMWKAKNSWKYKPEDTVMEIRSKRLWVKSSWIEKTFEKEEQENASAPVKTTVELEMPTEIVDIEEESIEIEWPVEAPVEQTIQKLEFDMPDDIQKIKELREILKANPWDIEIKISTHNLKVNQQGLDKINKLIG